MTILSSIRLDGSTQSVLFDGAVDRNMFDEYIREFLDPCLCPVDIVIADNLSAHKSQKAHEVIKMKLADIIFLPAYSPDFNPIEKMWSKVKQVLRWIKARTRKKLFEGIGKAMALVSENDAKGWFQSCGYGTI